MNCPACSGKLESVNFKENESVVVDVCGNCGGTWFDKGEVDRLDDSIWTNTEELGFLTIAGTGGNRKCPKCSTGLESLSPKDDLNLVVDRCPTCQGFWLDKDELERVRDIALKADAKIAEGMTMPKPIGDSRRAGGWSPLSFFIISSIR